MQTPMDRYSIIDNYSDFSQIFQAINRAKEFLLISTIIDLLGPLDPRFAAMESATKVLCVGLSTAQQHADPPRIRLLTRPRSP